MQLTVSHLNYSFNKNPVLDDVSFSLSGYGITGLLGLNGQGKTTLLKHLANILPSKNSQLSIDCSNTTCSMGYQPEKPAFYKELTVSENIEFGLALHNKTNKSGIEKTLTDCGLIQYANQLASKLSKGYQQRLALALAIVHQPNLLLLDEPTDGLDPQQRAETHKLIKALGENSMIILSSHRLEDIKQLCSRVLILHNGTIASDITFNESQNQASIESLFSSITQATAA